MPSIADLFINVSSDVSGAISGLTDVDSKLKSTASAMETAAPVAIALGAAAATVGVGFTTSVGAAGDFEHQINGIKAVMSPAEVQTFGQAIEDLALKLGKDTVFSASQAAQGIEEMIKAGVPLPAILGGAAASALDLAAATGVSIVQAATLASTAMNTYHQSAAQLPATMDTISNISNATAISVGSLQLALQAVGPVAAGVGLSFNDTATALGIFANNGLIGSDAGTSLKTMLLNLQPATKSQSDELKALGIITADGANQFFDASGKAKSMSEIFQILKESTSGLTLEQKINALQTAFGTDAVRAATIAATEGAAGWDAVTASMDKMGGTQVAATQRMQGLTGALSQLSGSFDTVQITVGQFFLPVLTQLALAATGVLNAFLDLDPKIQLIITSVIGATGAIAGLLSAWVLLGPVVLNVAAAFEPFLVAITPLIGGLGLLAGAGKVLYDAWQADFGGIQEVVAAVGPAVQTFLNSFSSGLSLLSGAISLLLTGDITGFLNGVSAAAQNFAATFGPAFAELAPVVLNALNLIGSALANWITTTGLPQLGAWAQAFIDWIGPLIPVLLARLSDLATAVFQWVATTAVPSLLSWAQAFIDWIGPVVPPLIAELGKILTAIGGWLVSTLPTIAQYLVEWASAFLDWVLPLIPPLLSALGQLVVTIATWVASVAPSILQALLQWATVFLAWVTPLIPPILQALGEIVVAIVTWVLSVAPTILNALLQWATAFLSWVTPLIPPILLQLAQLAVTIVEWIVGTALPMIVQALLQFATAFLNWVAPIIPVLIAEIAQLFFTVVGWIITTGLPVVLSAIMQVAQTFVGWAVPLIPVLLQELGTFLVAMASWIIGTALPAIVGAVLRWADSFIGWVAPAIPVLLLELAQLATSVATWIIGTALPLLTQAALQFGTAFLSWVAPLIPPMLLELGTLLAAIANWVITVAAPILLQQLSVWGMTFIEWVGNTIPPLLLELGNLLLAIGTWIVQYGVPTLVNLTLQWVAPFLDWIVNSVIPQIGPLLAGLIAFIGEALKSLPDIIISVLGDPWAPFVNATYGVGARIGTALINLGDVISQNLGPALGVIRDLLTPVLETFLALPEPVQNVILAIGGVVAAAVVFGGAIGTVVGVLSTVLEVVGGVVAAIGAPILLIIAAAALLYAAWQDDFGGIREVTEQVWEAIQPAFQNIANFAGTIGQLFGDAFKTVSAWLTPLIEQLSQSLAPILAKLPDGTRALGDAFNAMGVILGQVADAIRFLVTGDMDAFMRLLGDTSVPQRFTDALSFLHDAFDHLGPVVHAAFDSIGILISGIGDFIGLLTSGDVQGAFNSLLNTFGKIKETMQPAWEAFLSWLGGALAQLPAFVSAQLHDLWNALGVPSEIQDQLNHLGSLFHSAFDAMTTLVGGIKDAAGQLASGDVQGAFNSIFETFGKAKDIMLPAWGDLLSWLGGLLAQLPGFIGDHVGDLWQGFLEQWRLLPEYARAAWITIKIPLGNLISDLSDLLGTAAQDLWQGLLEQWRLLPEYARAAWIVIKVDLGNLISDLSGFIGDRAGDLWNVLLDEFGSLPDLLAPYWANFLTWLGGELGLIPGLIGDAIGDIWGGLTAAFDALVPQLAPYWDNFASWLGSILGGIPQFVVDTAGDVFGGLVALFAGLIDLLSPYWDAFAGWFLNLLQGIPQFVIDNAGDVFGGIVQAAIDLAGRIAGAIDPIRELIANTFGNLGNWVTSGGTGGTSGTGGGTGGTGDTGGGGTGGSLAADSLTALTQAMALAFQTMVPAISATADAVITIASLLDAAFQVLIPATSAMSAAIVGDPEKPGSGITNSGPIVAIGTLVIASQEEANAFLALVAQAVLASANRVTVPVSGGNPVLG